MPEAQIKGTSVLASVKFVKSRFGDDAHERILQELSPEARDAFGATVLSSAWFPFQVLVDYMVAADRLYGHGDYALCEESGRFSAYESLSTLYKLLIRFSNPLAVVQRAAGMWQHFNSSGQLKVVNAADGHAVLHIVDFASPHLSHCRRQVGWFGRAVEATGGKKVRVTHPRCRTSGADVCEYIVRWEK